MDMRQNNPVLLIKDKLLQLMNGHEMYSAQNYFSMLEETGSFKGSFNCAEQCNQLKSIYTIKLILIKILVSLSSTFSSPSTFFFFFCILMLFICFSY